MGWNKYQKADKTKIAQMVLYKQFYAEQFNVDPDMIDIEYFIVRRKLPENSPYPVKRIQSFVPASGKPTRNKLTRALNEFVSNGFNADGTHNADGNFLAIAGKNSKHCKYCEFKDQPDLCASKERIR